MHNGCIRHGLTGWGLPHSLVPRLPCFVCVAGVPMLFHGLVYISFVNSESKTPALCRNCNCVCRCGFQLTSEKYLLIWVTEFKSNINNKIYNYNQLKSLYFLLCIYVLKKCFLFILYMHIISLTRNIYFSTLGYQNREVHMFVPRNNLSNISIVFNSLLF